MGIKELQTAYACHPQVKAFAKALAAARVRNIRLSGLQASSAALAFAATRVAVTPAKPLPLLLFILDDQEEAGYFYHDLVQVMGEQSVLFFPSSFRRAVKFGQRDAANEILRTEVLTRISEPGLVVVSYPEAIAEKVVSRRQLDERTLQIKVGEQLDLSFVVQTLQEFGFQRTDYVYEPGQFAVRGSLVDVFSFSNEYPFRIDFFGDEVDSIRTFEVESQLSRGQQELISLVPELGREGSDGVPFSSLLPGDAVVVARDFAFVTERIGQIWQEGFSQQALLEEAATSEREEEELQRRLRRELVLIDAPAFERGFEAFKHVAFSASGREPSADSEAHIAFSTTAQPIFHKNFDLVTKSFEDYLLQGYTLYILADSAKQTDRLQAIFADQAPDVHFVPVDRTLHAGFADNTIRACFFTDHQIFDRFHKYNLRSERARSGKVALSLKELREFEVGDFVVHVDHGIGRFGGLIRVPQADGHMQEMIKITYDHEDVVYVSIHALHKVSKYKGKEGEPPRISRLGTGAWERMKERTKSKIKDIARDLIRLYSRRREEKGFKFSPDSYLQHELEASFLYEDTPDQLKATNDVKADMERARPMDRLVCGDVGFGKTEVAVRAAFKAATDGKQVAVMVPTTVLAYQHFHTFSDRLKGLPVRVDYLSRARTPKQTRELLADLEAGKIDIIVGTHKLIGRSVRFKDLGLLIIDEEQKFGVATKEKLRQMKVNVDTLTLTATPIPRTLQFSLMGARDLSVIQTPPPNRYPIQTEVHSFSPEVIAEAVGFEMSRNGQVFIVNNRIAGLPELEQIVHKYVPDARVAVAHGQMHPEELERVMMAFASYDYDVLISTTIIESGLDIPNANTIIICSAQNFGLSDLHQMRGRVGRSNKKAFCYLLAPPLGLLPQESRRRLQAIENFSDLGSGIQIAMQDLDIRGAGNLLGAEQSGFIADLGYETYQKILSEAVKELKNDEFKELYAQQVASGEVVSGEAFVDECQLESDMPMSFPEDFVPGSSERMLLYRELDGLETEEAIEAFRQRLVDRFGPIPETAQELIRVVRLRRLGKYFGAERVMIKNGRMRLYFVKDDDSPFFQSPAFGQCITYFSLHATDCQLDEVKGRRSMLIKGIDSVKKACAVLDEMQQITPNV
ncbi:MAG: transcription-repair coupling factor [Bacteroidales bacterium]|nr:transcription-repair coupling factor [Bacteroidales bacterium]